MFIIQTGKEQVEISHAVTSDGLVLSGNFYVAVEDAWRTWAEIIAVII